MNRLCTSLSVAVVALSACTKDSKPPATTGQASAERGQTAAPTPPAPVAAKPTEEAAAPGPWMTKAAEGKDIYATLKTSMGDVAIKLFSKDAPKTVANFVGLASGEKTWVDPKTGTKSNKALYDGTIFHRVIPDFMIQGGDPLGQGTGDPGYRFEDEFQSGRKFDKPGILAMANAGPNTNGSQFFITTSTPAHLNGRHTIFGEVVSGYEVVEAISKVPRGMRDRPTTDVVIKGIELSDAAPQKAPAAGRN